MIRLLVAFFVAAASLGQSAAAPTAQPARFSLAGAIEQGGLVTGNAPASTVRLTLGGTAVPVASDGRFIIGFDRDAHPSATLAAELPDGRIVREELRVAPRAWPVEHVSVAQRPRASTEEYRRIRAAELARIASARASRASSEGWRQRPIWPALGRISGRFGSQRVYRGQPGAYHSGVDVAAGAGAPVAAPADGVVVLAGPPAFSLEGNLVIIDHGMGLNSAFLHLSESMVSPGQRVRQGQMIGRVGATGRATGPHLHWSMKWGDARLDPARIAGPMAD
jgi:murein DD-endopeptidase MepM/ murein hydrolase activator NlpD